MSRPILWWHVLALAPILMALDYLDVIERLIASAIDA